MRSLFADEIAVNILLSTFPTVMTSHGSLMSLWMACLYWHPLRDLGPYCPSDVSQIRISLAADEEIVSWQERLVLPRGCFLAVNKSLTLEVIRQLVDTVGNPLSSIPC